MTQLQHQGFNLEGLLGSNNVYVQYQVLISGPNRCCHLPVKHSTVPHILVATVKVIFVLRKKKSRLRF